MLRRRIFKDDCPSPGIDPPPKTWVAGIGATALVGLLLTGLLLVSTVAARPGPLSPPTHSRVFPSWLAGPLHGLWSLPLSNSGLVVAFVVAISAMYVFYILAFLCAPRLRRRWTIAAILVAHVIFFLSPPLPLTDVFNYLNYGRMEIVHGLNPYLTIPELEPHSDPAFALSNWHHLLSPYGPLFTMLTFALVPLGVAASFWIFKGTLMLVSLAILWLVWRCAELLHRDPLKAVLLVGLNPLVLVWGLGGDHNDFLMMLFVMLAVLLLLRSRSAGFADALTVREELVGGERRASGRLRRDSRPGRRRGGRFRPPALGGRSRALGEAIAPARAPLVGRWLLQARGWSIGPGSAGSLAALPAVPAGGGASGLIAGPPLVRPLGIGLPRRRGTVLEVGRAELLEFGCGLALVCALAIKLPAAILIPIVVVVATRRSWLIGGILAATAVILLASYLAFGAHVPDLGTQSSLVTRVGLPNLLGYGLGLGGETAGLRAALTVGLLVVVAGCWQWARRRNGDWVAPAGAAIFVLLATLSWQAPWYILWLLPFAALTRRSYMRITTLVFGVYLIAAFIPSVILAPPDSALQRAQADVTQQLVR